MKKSAKKCKVECYIMSERVKHKSKERKIYEEGNASRCEKIARNRTARRPRENAYVVNRDGESRRFMVNSSVEIESRRDSRFVLLRPISYSCACDHRRSTSTYFMLHLGTLKHRRSSNRHPSIGKYFQQKRSIVVRKMGSRRIGIMKPRYCAHI